MDIGLVWADEINNLDITTRTGAEASDQIKYLFERIPATFVLAGVDVEGSGLVYGGHTIGLALSQGCRAIPDIVTVAGWAGCDHLGPAHEGDALTSRLEVTRLAPGGLVHLRSTVAAAEPVLDWRFTVVLA